MKPDRKELNEQKDKCKFGLTEVNFLAILCQKKD